MFGGVYTGTPVPGVPIALGDVWRAVNLAVAVVLIVYWSGMVQSAARREYRMPTFSAWGMAAMIVFTVRATATQVERWNTRIVWEGAPSLSLALAFGAMNAVAMRRAMDRFAAGKTATRGSIRGATQPQEKDGAGDDLQRPT